MITAKNQSVHEAVDYYTQKLDANARTTRWYGKGAARLGLSGEISNKEIFRNICYGRSPDGKQKLGRNTKRAAIDLTFSVPKSVSLSALVGGDERLIDAHRQAVEQTLKIIEQHYAKTRIQLQGKRCRTSTNNLIVAQFDHWDSRECDPHLHTHALAMNLTWVESMGNWYSLSNGDIYKDKKPLSMLYHAYLKEGVQKLGYEVEDLANGLFEIKGYKREDLMNFSKRRQQILAETGYSGCWKTREEAWEITRKAKQYLSLQELKEMWAEQCQGLGITPVVAKNTSAVNLIDEQEMVKQNLQSKTRIGH